MINTVVSTAWKEPYKNSGDILESVLRDYVNEDVLGQHYARYASITQSSGTGKSRMVDELAKKIFCIPIALGSNQAYPPPDNLAVSWFGGDNTDMRAERAQFFMCALFETALQRAKDIAPDPHGCCSAGLSLASIFRQSMSDGMEYGQHGQYRQQFYSDVCVRAAELLSSAKHSKEPRQPSPTPVMTVVDDHGTHINLVTAAEALVAYISTTRKKSFASNSGLDVILYFDEAQHLTKSSAGSSGPTFFIHVRSALRLVRKLPIFALFLSTTGKLEQFSAPAQLDASDRMLRLQLLPFKPIVWTPLDIMAQRITKNKVWTLREVASTYHIVHLGRPL
ncbi:hypothetical protein C2E23DRAFT_683962, partial [Lenzites betulinus]